MSGETVGCIAQQPTVAVAVGINLGPLAETVLEVVEEKDRPVFHRVCFTGSRPAHVNTVVSDVVGGEVDRRGETRHADTELDVVDKETVAIGIHAAVLGVGPCEGVGARGHDVRIVVPASHILPVRELQHSVNEELTYIPVRSLSHALGIEGDVAGVGVVIGGLDSGAGGGYSRVAASHTVSAAVVAAVGGIHDDPRIGGIIDEGILAEVARLEVDDVRNDDDASCGSETRRYPFAVAQGTALVGDPHVVGGDGVEPGQRQIGVKRGFIGR